MPSACGHPPPGEIAADSAAACEDSLDPVQRTGRPARCWLVPLIAPARLLPLLPLLPLLLSGLLAACDDAFQPIKPGGPPFSIYGYLDASADTQWIRLSPLRTLLLASAQPTGVAVTLENLGTGRVMPLRDSAMRYPDMLGADTVNAHTFWTAERIEPGASYRFRAEGQDGAVAESVVRIPRDYDVEFWIGQRFGSYVHAEGLKQLPFIFWHVEYYDACYESRTFRYIQYVAPGGDSLTWLLRTPGPTYADWNLILPRCPISLRFTITRQDGEVVGAEDPWPTGQDYSAWRLAPGAGASNVSGALGFIGGVLTKWTRAESCQVPAPPTGPEIYCKLRYDSTTATLRGRVGSSCTIPPDSVHVTLQELAAPAGELPRTRTGIIDVAGRYDIGALRPGIPHQLTVFVGDSTGRYYPRPPFRIVYDTLRFTAGKVVTHDAILAPIGSCPRL